MTRVALTGGIATGKSHVRRRLAEKGVPTIDADETARQAVAPGTPTLDAIRRHFGDTVFSPAGTLDRKALAALVFADPGARHALEQIVHPEVRRRTDQWFAEVEATGATLAVADIPLLYETGRERDFDAVIVTACEPDRQLQRLMARDSLSEAEARARIAAQFPTSDKVARATYVIRTDSTVAETDAQVDRLLARLAPRATH